METPPAPSPHTPKLHGVSSQQSQTGVGWQHRGRGCPVTILSLTGVGDHTAYLWSLQGGLEVLLGHPFLCHQEAPGHLGVLADQGGQWLLLDLDRPGRSSHRHGETKWCEQAPGSLMLAWGALNTCTASLGHGHSSPGPHHPGG